MSLLDLPHEEQKSQQYAKRQGKRDMTRKNVTRFSEEKFEHFIGLC